MTARQDPPVTGRDLAELPKAHLHVHLESTVPVPKPLVFNGFREFADHNSALRESLRTAEDFTRLAREFAEAEAADGTRYVEVTFTAAAHGERLGDPELPLEAVLEGFRSTRDLEVRVLLDHSRRRSVERARETLRLARKYDEVVGIGLAGDESHPAAPFAEVFAEARAAGLHVVHHAGETSGPASIREALVHAERIGHGIRALDDPELVAELRDCRVPLEVCPSSNVALGLVASFAAHPLPALREAGLVVTVNTDIPNLAGTTLTEEFRRVRRHFGYDDASMAELNRAAIDASFAAPATKARLHAATEAWLSRGVAGSRQSTP
jgi:adenosine deaminase